ncbi:SBBP repeat-containing protein [Neisseriaceae bacterium ESL0693]|nr:SBBP repeat-containing protein [Neisseriaceae bacterium ESL0693]
MNKVNLFKILTILFFMIYGAETMAKTNVIASNFNAPTGIVFNQTGDMFVTNWSGRSIIKISPNGQRETVYSNIASPAGIVIDQDNNIYVASYSDNYILRINEQGKGTIIAENFHTPTGITLSKSGDLLISNRSSGDDCVIES